MPRILSQNFSPAIPLRQLRIPPLVGVGQFHRARVHDLGHVKHLGAGLSGNSYSLALALG